jgi:hypothetical protein
MSACLLVFSGDAGTDEAISLPSRRYGVDFEAPLADQRLALRRLRPQLVLLTIRMDFSPSGLRLRGGDPYEWGRPCPITSSASG